MRAINEHIRCKDCGFIFDEPNVEYETYEAYGSSFSQKYETRPACGGWALEDYYDRFDEQEEDIPSYCGLST